MLLGCEVSEQLADSENCVVFPSIYTKIAFCDIIVAIEMVKSEQSHECFVIHC